MQLNTYTNVSTSYCYSINGFVNNEISCLVHFLFKCKQKPFFNQNEFILLPVEQKKTSKNLRHREKNIQFLTQVVRCDEVRSTQWLNYLPSLKLLCYYLINNFKTEIVMFCGEFNEEWVVINRRKHETTALIDPSEDRMEKILWKKINPWIQRWWISCVKFNSFFFL